MAKILLTKALLQSVTCPGNQAKLAFFDAGCRGLVLEVRPTGTKIYALRYLDSRGKQRQFKIGNADDLSLDQARKQAAKLRNQIALGEDIEESKDLLKQVPTVNTFIHDSYLPYVKGYKRSWKCDEGLLRKHIEPIWGKRYLDQITKADLISLIGQHRTTHAPGSCNRLLILLRYLFSCAIKWETPGITKNPTAGIPLMKEDNQKDKATVFL